MSITDAIFLIGRIIYGGYLIKSSWNHFAHHKDLVGYASSKNVPMPNISVLLAGIFLLLGGLGIVFGVYVQWAVISIALFFIPVTFMMHQYWKEQDGQRMSDNVNFYKNLALLGAALIFLAIPLPWPLALF